MSLKVKNFRMKHPKNMIIGQYNVNSIRNKFIEIKPIFDLQLCDILGVSETKLDDSFPLSQFCVENYKLHRQDRNDKGGGIMIYVKDTIPHKIVKEYKI